MIQPSLRFLKCGLLLVGTCMLANFVAAAEPKPNVIVFLTDDQGWGDLGCYGHPRIQSPNVDRGPYRGYKADIWEGGHRVPFLVRWPSIIKPNSSSSQLICHVDLIATCADILSVRLPGTAAVDSVSFLPALHGTDQAPLREAVVHHSIDGMFAIRQGKWKLEFCAGSGGWGSPKEVEARSSGLPAVQLYDLDSDMTESKNIESDNPNVVEQLTQLLNKYIADGRSTPGPKQSNDVDVEAFKTGKRK
ncbi:MAG: sulfatase-like hydrolase/transferase [Pirellula sp.]